MTGEWKPGDIIYGQDTWLVDRVLKGGMGIVYVVSDMFSRVFAAKTFQDEVFDHNPEIAKRFSQEATAWINLEAHDNVARARFVDIIQGKPYLFLEFVSGGDLSRWIGTPRLTGNPQQVLKFAIQFCDGMHHALSKGITAHRDIKPQNCLVTEDGTLKVTDFGLAKVVSDLEASAREAAAGGPGVVGGSQAGPTASRSGFLGWFSSTVQQPSIIPPSVDLSRTGLAAGTCTHMAPEQFSDSKHVDVRADVYSFGVMLFQMATGRLPFNGRSWQEFERLHRTEAPPSLTGELASLDGIVKSCLAKIPDGRPANFDILRHRLAEEFQRITGQHPPARKTGKDLDATELYNKGLSLAALSKFDQALATFDECLANAITDESLFEHATVNRGIVLFELGRYDEAIACYDRALEIDPSDEKIWCNKGVVLNRRGYLPEAKECFERAIRLNPNFDTAVSNMGLVLHGMGESEEALQYYDRAQQLNPNDFMNLSNKGKCLSDLGRFDEALACYEAGLRANPRNAILWSNKALVYGELGRPEDELRCYDEALKYDPLDIEAWFNKGVTLRHLNRIDAAIGAYDGALKVDSSYLPALQKKAFALMVAERYSEAATVCEKTTALAPENPDVWLLRGDALFYSGHPDQAIHSYEKAGQLGSEKADESVEKCRRVLRSRQATAGGGSNPDGHQLAGEHFNMAHASIRAGNRAEAVQHYLKSMELVGEATPADRTFKAFVAYQCGVCLLNQYQLGGVDPAWFSKQQKEGASMIRNLWGTTLRLYQTLNQSDLQTEFGSLLRKHVPAITRDPIMR
jgi:tetratricopeptide (TPR) repeat protein/tRNA A-37 threonylcarbamoyl transferase component Bud32